VNASLMIGPESRCFRGPFLFEVRTIIMTKAETTIGKAARGQFLAHLAEALRPASGNLKDITLKSRQMKVRLGMTLLSLHRASVRGVKPATPPAPRRTRAEIQQDWEAGLDAMKERMIADDSAAE
jgi:hypothetical protein